MASGAMNSFDEIFAGFEDLRAEQEAFYQDLHRHPELSHAERRTARRVAERLQRDGFAVQTGIGGTGVVGTLANGDGPTVLLRCELDGLPVKEDTGAPYASTATATDAMGHEVPVAHACGHDLHMSCLLGMAKLMAGRRDLAAEKDGRLEELPTNHSPKFLPPMQPCLRTGTEALTAAALAWLAR